VSAVLFLAGLGLGAGGAVAGLVLPGRARGAGGGRAYLGGMRRGFAASAWVLASGVPVTVRSAAVLPLTGVVISLDRFGAVFAVTAAVVGAAACCYSAGYLARGHESRAVAALPLFVTSLLLVPAAASIVTFMAAWELMALSSLLLLTGHRRAEARATAQ
jgi:hydrogenase-4 component B